MSNYKGFSRVKMTAPQKSTFDLTHDVRLSAKAGYLIPVLTMEAVPSDKFNGSSEMLVRMAPLLAPIYDQVLVYVHYFFVPNRLLWDEWETFITGGRLGAGVDPPFAPAPPYILMGQMMTYDPNIFGKSSVADYMGVPILPVTGEVASDYNNLQFDVMPFLAYSCIWFNYYRDRNFVTDDDYTFPYPSGEMTAVEAANHMNLFKRNYMHDYFTSALPFTQRGQEVLIPMDASVSYLQQSIVKRSDTGATMENSDLLLGTQDATTSYPPGSLATYNGYTGGAGPGEGVTAARIENIEDISNISTTINDFRSAYALQVWLERNAVGGSRYTESTQAHFGIRPQDSRLQRPEYIGGGRINVKISEVLATANSLDADDNVVPQANMAGHGVSYGNTNTFNYFCTEHGFIIGLMSIMVPPSYHQGLPKMFRRREFLDYPWPTFAKLGEQQVDVAEIYADSTTLTPDPDTGILPEFGYQSRYADWKYIPNGNRGDFHDTLLFWTCTRDFATAPELGLLFNEFDTTTVNRVFAVQDGTDNFWIYVHNKITVSRPLPYFGTPNTLGFV